MSVAGEHPLTKLTREMFEEEEFPFTEIELLLDQWNYLIGSRKIINLV